MERIASKHNELRVFGVGNVIVVPDCFLIKAEINTLEPTAMETKEANDQKMESLLNRLGELGYQQRDIQTVSYQLHPQYTFETDQQILRGYELSHQFVIESEDFEQLGQLIDELTQYGVTRIIDVTFTQINRDELYQTALQLAVVESQAKARNIADTLGVKLNFIPSSVTEIVSSSQNPLMRTMPAEFLDHSTILQRGEMTIEAKVEAVYSYH